MSWARRARGSAHVSRKQLLHRSFAAWLPVLLFVTFVGPIVTVVAPEVGARHTHPRGAEPFSQHSQQNLLRREPGSEEWFEHFKEKPQDAASQTSQVISSTTNVTCKENCRRKGNAAAASSHEQNEDQIVSEYAKQSSGADLNSDNMRTGLSIIEEGFAKNIGNDTAEALCRSLVDTAACRNTACCFWDTPTMKCYSSVGKIPCENTFNPPSGVEACETKGFAQDVCDQVGCCEWQASACKSRVGSASCHGLLKLPHSPPQDTCRSYDKLTSVPEAGIFTVPPSPIMHVMNTGDITTATGVFCPRTAASCEHFPTDFIAPFDGVLVKDGESYAFPVTQGVEVITSGTLCGYPNDELDDLLGGRMPTIHNCSTSTDCIFDGCGVADSTWYGYCYFSNCYKTNISTPGSDSSSGNNASNDSNDSNASAPSILSAAASGERYEMCPPKVCSDSRFTELTLTSVRDGAPTSCPELVRMGGANTVCAQPFVRSIYCPASCGLCGEAKRTEALAAGSQSSGAAAAASCAHDKAEEDLSEYLSCQRDVSQFPEGICRCVVELGDKLMQENCAHGTNYRNILNKAITETGCIWSETQCEVCEGGCLVQEVCHMLGPDNETLNQSTCTTYQGRWCGSLSIQDTERNIMRDIEDTANESWWVVLKGTVKGGAPRFYGTSSLLIFVAILSML